MEADPSISEQNNFSFFCIKKQFTTNYNKCAFLAAAFPQYSSIFVQAVIGMKREQKVKEEENAGLH
ncbi:hypothetical protein [Bacillus sp. ISL-45]|uniref:hypothetical protein n=1 Tax=Bacillus sp. ISL-45 TaxID=2819128 RepID=UPI001BEB8344|nr:hypothetical protein [Bacillus sp. ISL-45]MBT2638833.1 hypothetical protein [Bacillus sp. ISL-39]